MTVENERSLFALDRRMEFKLRLAAKKAKAEKPGSRLASFSRPEREIIDRLIARLRQL